MANNVFIIYNLYSFDSKSITIGGVQTYLTDLIEIMSGMKWNVWVLQYGQTDSEEKLHNCTIRQYKSHSSAKMIELAVHDIINVNNDLIIYGTDTIIHPSIIFKKSIAIQHGICWDIPVLKKNSILKQLILNSFSSYKLLKRFEKVNKIVCVDHNFVNWYRSQTNSTSEKLVVIPNYTRIAGKSQKPTDCINIIFARRFWWYRGTRVFCEAIKKILDEYQTVNVTIAGNGPDEDWMRNYLKGYQKVKFISYNSAQSLQIHEDKHIAVVPTVGSEGTSLSLLEAMSAQCAVICTNVGGMTNIVLDRFNGRMVSAGSSEELYNAIKDLVIDEEERLRIANYGYETVARAFSYDLWEKRWKTILNNVING